MYTLDVERDYKKAGDLLNAERYREALHLAQDLEASIPGSPGVAMLEALNFFMLGRKEEASEACTRALERVEAIRENSEVMSDFLTDTQLRDLRMNLDTQKTKATALFQSFGREADAFRLSSSDDPSSERALSKSGQAVPRAPEPGDTLEQLSDSLLALEAESKESSESQRMLVEELKKLREADASNSSELERAHREVEELQRSLKERDEAFEAAQENNAAHEGAMTHLKEELNSARKGAEESANSERAMKEQLDLLGAIESEKTDELRGAREEMQRLAEELRAREEALEFSTQGESDGEEALELLQSELAKLQGEVQSSAESEKVLTDELDRLRSVEQEQTTALDSARSEMVRLEDDLRLREQRIAAAEQSEGERKAAARAMKAELEHLRTEAVATTSSEQQLTEELAQLRSAEQERAVALEQARAEMEALQRGLEDREKTIQAAQQSDAERAKTIDSLQAELSSLRDDARDATESENSLSERLNQLGVVEAEKSKELENSREDVESLKMALREREQTIAASEQNETERQQTIDELQIELDVLRREAVDASASKAILLEDLERLRGAEGEKSSELNAARSEVEELKYALRDREKTISAAEREKLNTELVERERALNTAEESSTRREEAITELQSKLEEMEARADNKAASEEAIAGELDRFRSASAESLAKARSDMARLEEELASRELAVEQAESSRISREKAIAELDAQLDAMHAEAATKAASEMALGAELERFRSASAQAQAQAELELAQLKGQLAEREDLVRASETVSGEREKAIGMLQVELVRTKEESAAKAKTQEALENELESFRMTSAEAMEKAREEMGDLRRRLSQRARDVESEEARTTLRESAIEQLQSDLQRVKTEAQQKSKSEEALSMELEQFKSESAAAMDEARLEVEEMERQLQERAEVVHHAEEEAGKRESEIRRLRDNLSATHEKAEQKAAAEQELAEELEKVRLAKSKELRSAQELVDHMQVELEEREHKIETVQAASTEKEQLLHELQSSLKEVENRANLATREAEESKTEKSRLTENVEAKEQALTAALKEIEELKSTLSDKETAVEVAAEKGFIRDKAIFTLQSDLESLRVDSRDTGKAERRLSKEITKLQSEQETDQQHLEHAREEAQALRSALETRSASILAIERKVKKSSAAANRERAPVRSIFVVVAALVAVYGISYQLFRSGDITWPPRSGASQVSTQGAQTQEPLSAQIAIIEPALEASVAVEPRVSPPARIIRFDVDESVGRLRARAWDASNGAWRIYGDARGPITLPAGKVLELRVENAATVGLSSLSSLGHDSLHTLILRGETITDEEFAHIVHLTSLEELSIVSTEVTEDQLASLRNFRRLRTLSLKGTPVSQATLEVLAGMRWLRELDVRDTGVDLDGLRLLHAAMPTCAIAPKPPRW